MCVTATTPASAGHEESQEVPNAQEPADRRSWVERHVPLFVALCSVLTAVLGFFGAILASPLWQESDDRPSAPTEAKVSGKVSDPPSPKVGSTTPFSGTVENVPPGYAVWSVVKDADSGALYPKYGPCALSGVQWDCGQVFPVKSSEEYPEKQSELQAWLVDAAGAAEIMRYVMDAEDDDGKQPSAFKIPESSIPVDSMRVVLSE